MCSLFNFNGFSYPIIQINGQRICGPPKGYQGKEPIPDKCEIYLNNLPRYFSEEELLPIFSKCGAIFKLRVMMCFSGTNRGYAYILYFTPEAAKRCLVWLKSVKVADKIIYSHPSSNKRILIMGHVSPNILDVEKFCMQHTECIEVQRIGQKRYFYLIFFRDHYAAAMARRKFVLFITDGTLGTNCFIKWYKKV